MLMIKNVITASMLAAGLLFNGVLFAQEKDTTESSSNSKNTGEPLPLEQIKAFAEIFSQIKKNYVSPVDDKQLLTDAIKGMLNGLDPHSTYLDVDDSKKLDEDTSGHYGGLGMEVMLEDGFVKVVAPIDNSPAAEAGIQTGDLIIRIDGESISGLSLNESIDLMRGKAGDPITITVLRKGRAEPFDVPLVRDLINDLTVRSERLNDDILYLRVTQFKANTAELFRKEIIGHQKELKGLILDLRNNPGGLLNSAIAISDSFIDNGTIVSTKGRNEEKVFDASPTQLLEDIPVIVLINGGSASASEIVSGALQDHKRALILGTESFGKGSVQRVVNIGDEAIKLTMARYYTPSGRSIQASGIVPDVVVEPREFKDKEKHISAIKEKNLHGHLDNSDKKSKTQKTKKSKQKAQDSADKAKKNAAIIAADYQLNEAVNILKGLIFLTRKDEPEQNKPNVHDE